MGFNGGGLTRRGGGAAIVDKLFKMTINTTGTFFLPLNSAAMNVTVNWGDGSSDVITSYNQTERTHVYATAGVYQISIDGQFGGMAINQNAISKLQVASIDNWGTAVLSSGSVGLRGCSNMVGYYTDNPNMSICTTTAYMFNLCSSFNSPLTLDMSKVTTTTNMFSSASSFNSLLTLNDTSKVTTTTYMFNGCSSYNKPLTLDLKNCTTMNNMFNGCSSLNSLLTFNNTSNVTNMGQMFVGNTVFNTSVSSFDTSSVTNMYQMFRFASAFNQDLSGWNISSLTNATLMLNGTSFDTTNYDLLLISWAAQTHNNNVPFHAGTAKYSPGAAANARAVLIADGWTITDGGQV